MDRLTAILLGVDFTPPSAAALRQALRLARASNATLTAVHVLEEAIIMEMERALSDRTNVRSAIEQAAQRSWREFIASIPEAQDFPLQVVKGEATESLVRAVATHGADLLVLGTHGRSHRQTGVGSTAYACTRRVKSKMLLVEPNHNGRFSNVLGCVDFSDTSRRAVEQAIGIAQRDGAVLHILHVFDGPWNHVHYRTETLEVAPEFQEQYTRNLALQLKEFTQPLLGEIDAQRVRHHIMDYASFGGGITKFAVDNANDLVVIGTKGHSLLHDLLLGSTVERVLRETPCSILTIPPQPADA